MKIVARHLTYGYQVSPRLARQAKLLSIGLPVPQPTIYFDQNEDLINPPFVTEWPVDELVDYCKEYQIKNIIFDYTEPLQSRQELPNILQLLKENRFFIAIKTYCSYPQRVKELEDYVDLWQLIVYSGEQRFYRKHTNFSLEAVKETLHYLSNNVTSYTEIITPLIADENTQTGQIKQLVKLLGEVNIQSSWLLIKQIPYGQLKDKVPVLDRGVQKVCTAVKKMKYPNVLIFNKSN